MHKHPGPITREKDQLQIITQNVRGMIEVKKKKLIINKCHELFKENPSTIISNQILSAVVFPLVPMQE